MSDSTFSPARAPGDVVRALAEQRRSIDALARMPFVNARTITVTLPNAVTVHVRHGLGRRFTNYFLSAPKGATTSGRIVESDGDETLEVVLTATGYGATVTARMTVF